ncbi:MAG TPA: hypothetical protein VK590_08590 [Saprospiraceae bacterium]|nr:hypothetical protein [Saprospiraceae bacterium]
MYTANLNFDNDFDNILINFLKTSNFSVDPNLTSRDLRMKFFNFRKRQIDPQPRKILFSNKFVCPPQHQRGLDILISKIESGENLTPYLSKFIADLDYNDPLLNDWGIYHLHLGEAFESNGSSFIDRTGQLLFLRVDNENAMLINVLSHNSWTDQQMLREIHENWPLINKSIFIGSK